MKPLEIEKVEIYVTGDENADRVRWATYMGPIYTTNIICRITTKDGYEGVGATIAYTEHNFDMTIGEAVRPYLPDLIGKSALDRESIWNWMANRPNWLAFPTISIIDIALWDIAAKYAKMPLYQMLGADRNKILSYASTPMFDDTQTYLDYIQGCIDHGFKAIKLHCYCEYDMDVELVKAVDEHFKNSGVKFMLDVDRQYNREEAYKMAKLLEELEWVWLEAPLSDHDLEGYRDLVAKTNVPISCGGNSLITLPMIQLGINMKCWTDVRADATVVGGITPMKKIMELAQANNMRVEGQSWGMTLTQAANLHIMLAYSNCTYFEQAYPYEPFEIGSLDVIRTDKDGYVHAPKGNGLGVRMDWEAVEKITLMKYEVK